MEGVIQSRAQQLNVFYDEMKKQDLLSRVASPDGQSARCRRHGRFPAVRCWRNISGQSIGVDGSLETL